MPELPEVETIVQDLRFELTGQHIVDCQISRASLVRGVSAEEFSLTVVGRSVSSVERRGKYIQIGLGDALWLIVHLGMSGRLSLTEAKAAASPHPHVVFTLEDGRELRYNDPRRFGRLGVGSQADLMATGVIPKLGPEANRPGFSLHERLRGKQVALKTALLDQKTLAGVGNIYADEALWRARLKPSQLAATVGKVAAARLQQALVEVLNEAISNRGSSIEGYRDAWGQKGRQQESLAVYGRGGEPCLRCGRTLHQKQIGGRSSVFCVHCQV